MKAIKFIIPLSIIIVFGCQSKNQNASEKIKKDEIKKEIDEVMYPLPSPFELTQMLNEIEASYIIGISNEPEKAQSYLSITKQALNLGIYSSDLAYAATYNLSADINLYFDAIKQIAKELDIMGAINKEIAGQIEESIETKEKVAESITNLFYNTYSYMNKTGNTELSYLILAGTWIEGIYLTINISDNTFDNINIVKIIMKQEESLKKIIELMDEYKSNKMIEKTYTILKSINAIYELEEGTDALSMKQLNEISKRVADYRSEIVQ
ncbi:MAG: hypothetical protein JXB17_03085 [Bacteroidales bacterium]|nr:hypothetical protein [Bacteroidales bacterium]